MNAVDPLIDLAVTRAEAMEAPAGWLVSQGRTMRGVYSMTPVKRNPPWTPEERSFLKEKMYTMTIEQLALALGRTPAAIKIKIVRWRLERPSKRSGYLTGQGVAKALGSDIHAIMNLYERQIMPLVKLPGSRGILQISRMRLSMWAVNPENWIYFRVKNMKDSHLQRLVQLAQSRWDDEWLTIGQAAEVLGGVDYALLNNRARSGKIPAKRWGNWWIRRSDLTGVMIHAGERRKGFSRIFTPGADAFIIRCRQDGINFEGIARMMKMKQRTVEFRWRTFLKKKVFEG